MNDYFNYRVNVFAKAVEDRPVIGGDTFAAIILQGSTGGSDPVDVQINWFSRDIGEESVFAVILRDGSGQSIEDAEFDFAIIQDGQEVMRSHITEPSSPGQAYGAQHSFTSAGSYVIVVENINGTGERVEFPVQVTPEFPVLIASVMAAVMGLASVMGRLRRLL